MAGRSGARGELLCRMLKKARLLTHPLADIFHPPDPPIASQSISRDVPLARARASQFSLALFMRSGRRCRHPRSCWENIGKNLQHSGTNSGKASKVIAIWLLVTSYPFRLLCGDTIARILTLAFIGNDKPWSISSLISRCAVGIEHFAMTAHLPAVRLSLKPSRTLLSIFLWRSLRETRALRCQKWALRKTGVQATSAESRGGREKVLGTIA